MNYYFYDTSSLLEENDNLFSGNKEIVISSVSLKELENIKTSNCKDEEIKYKARRVIRQLSENPEKYTVWVFENKMLEPFNDFEINEDIKILACAFDYDHNIHPDETIFVTNDLSLKNIANLFFGEDSILSVENVDKALDDVYCGYMEICASDEELSYFYEHPYENIYDLQENEYLLLYQCIDSEVVLIDRLVWREGHYRSIFPIEFNSIHFGKVTPIKNDPFQILAMDSLAHNQVSMICGKPGSGKTFLSFAYLFQELERGALDQIIVFCNPVVARNAAKLGYYKGTALEKMLQTQAGMVLSSKLGSPIEVEKLIASGKLVLVPAGDARGYEVPSRSGVYIMESQNLTVELLRMLLQRVSEDCKVIVDGDYYEQVDVEIYGGAHNGMKKMSEVFRGQPMYGQVLLQRINRSKIAAIADRMR